MHSLAAYDHFFNAIDVVQSLPIGDLKTGERLFDSVLQPFGVAKGIPVALHRVGSAQEFLSVVAALADQAARQGRGPILHVDVHGLADHSGISLANGDTLSWGRLKGPFTVLNRATGLNLLVVVAACNGAHAIQTLDPREAAPVWGFVGPTVEVEAGTIDDGFRAFYRTFFEDFNGGAAVRALNAASDGGNGRFTFIGAEYIFQRVFAKYLSDTNQPVEKKRRVDAILDKIERGRRQSVTPTERTRLRAYIVQNIEQPTAYFQRAKRNFFLMDEWPMNAQRFKVSLESCRALASGQS